MTKRQRIKEAMKKYGIRHYVISEEYFTGTKCRHETRFETDDEFEEWVKNEQALGVISFDVIHLH